MSNILIFHGTGGHPKENWLPWLKTELETKGHSVNIPAFPTPEGQSLESWLKVFKLYEKLINEESVLIGHSLGGLFLLRVLERLKPTVKAAIFVSATIGVRPIKFYDADKKFSGFSFNWETIQTKADHFVVFHSDDDPYVSIGNAELLAKRLGVNLAFVPNAGHFNETAGYIRFNQLLEEVNNLLKK